MNSVHKGNRKVNESNIHTKKKLYSVHVAFWFFSFTSKTTPWQKRRSKADAINVRSFSLHLTQNGRAVLITVILGARNRFLLYRIWCASLYNFQHLFFFISLILVSPLPLRRKWIPLTSLCSSVVWSGKKAHLWHIVNASNRKKIPSFRVCVCLFLPHASMQKKSTFFVFGIFVFHFDGMWFEYAFNVHFMIYIAICCSWFSGRKRKMKKKSNCKSEQKSIGRTWEGWYLLFINLDN